MKKIALFTALLTLGIAVNAQTLNVQSAMADLKRGYLNKAKAAIDKACVHEDTKDDAKTWYYAGLIYAQIGGESKKAKSKYKDLDPDWCNKAYDAALRCKELDTKGEYTDGNNGVFKYIGNEYYNKSCDLFNSGDYTGALKASEEAIKVGNNAGDGDLANNAYYIAGFSCEVLHDTEGVKKYYGALVRKRDLKNFNDRLPRVYNTMVNIYKEANDTAKVIKTAEQYTKVMKGDPNSSILLASAYIWAGNPTKGIELAEKAVKDTPDTLAAYPMMLCAAAGIYEEAHEYEKAEATYKKSAQIQPNQIEANYGMGIMIYNRAVEKVNAINHMIDKGSLSEDDEILIGKLTDESNSFFEQAIPYLTQAISYIDGLSAEDQLRNRQNLHNCLVTLNTCYMRLEMLKEATAIKARITQLEKEAGVQ